MDHVTTAITDEMILALVADELGDEDQAAVNRFADLISAKIKGREYLEVCGFLDVVLDKIEQAKEENLRNNGG